MSYKRAFTLLKIQEMMRPIVFTLRNAIMKQKLKNTADRRAVWMVRGNKPLYTQTRRFSSSNTNTNNPEFIKNMKNIYMAGLYASIPALIVFGGTSAGYMYIKTYTRFDCFDGYLIIVGGCVTGVLISPFYPVIAVVGTARYLYEVTHSK